MTGDSCDVQGPAVIADKLSYFIRTGQMVGLFQAQGFRINYVQLAKYSPLPGVPAAAPEAAASTADAGEPPRSGVLNPI